MLGEEIYELCKELFPINRSLTGDGVRETLNILKREIPELAIYEVPSGTKCFDWAVPKEWNINEAYIIDPDGNKICNFKENNLHVVGYSIPVNTTIDLEDLEAYLYSLPELPEAIPYITSYYKERWGFCLSHNQRNKLKKGKYKVYIDSTLKDGNLTYGELLIKGDSEKEIFFSTYICHPSMANNELSGPTVVTYLAKYIKSLQQRRYSYRIIFIPETIGSIMYLSKHLDIMKKNVIAGFNVSCVGDNNNYSYLPSKFGNTLSDKVALHVLRSAVEEFKEYSFLKHRGSDERQYCSPGVDLPICSVMRTRYGDYKEYHTSLDNLEYISSAGLNGAYEVYKKIIEILELNYIYLSNVLCEPQLGKRGLYPTISTKNTKSVVANMMNFLAYIDGKKDLIEISNNTNISIIELSEIANRLIDAKLVSISNEQTI